MPIIEQAIHSGAVICAFLLLEKEWPGKAAQMIMKISSINWITAVIALLIVGRSAWGQSDPEPNCGVNSAISLAQTQGLKADTRDALIQRFPGHEVSLLDVKTMCQSLGIPSEGVRASLEELLRMETACIINLKNPNHFTVLLDGNENEVRLLDGEQSRLRIIPRSQIESRYTGFALLPHAKVTDGAAHAQFRQFDNEANFMALNQKVELHFPFSNNGKSPLDIEIVGTSCGCTGALLQGEGGRKLRLQPGRESEVMVTYRVDTQAPVQQEVLLRTNDPRRPRIYLSIRGQLPPDVSLSPPALYLSHVRGEIDKKQFRVLGPKGIHVARVWSDLPYLKFQVGNPELDGAIVRSPILILGINHIPAGDVRGSVWVQLNDKRTLLLSLRGEIEGDHQVPPESRRLPRAEDDHTIVIGAPLPTIKVGEMARDFALPDADGIVRRLSEFKGKKNVLLTFFPKCFTMGCATHLASLRDNQAMFDATNTQVMAVSTDSAEGDKGQRAFALQWQFKFPLLPDSQRNLSILYGAVQNRGEVAARMTFLIDKQGVVRYIDKAVQVKSHGSDLLEIIRAYQLDK